MKCRFSLSAVRVLPVASLLLVVVMGAPAWAVNLAQNPGFESGVKSPWVNFGATVSVQSSVVHSGTYAAHVQGRTASWNGVRQDFDTSLEVGKTYRILAWVRLVSGPSQTVMLTMKQTIGGATDYLTVASGTVSSTAWTKLDGGYTLSGTPSDLFLYVQTQSGTDSFYVDDALVEEYDWLADANARIEQHRKRDVRIRLVDPQGNPVDGVGLGISQTRHDFGFGSAINHNITNAQYAAFFSNNFEWAVMENESKWYANEVTQGVVDYTVADAITNFCYQNDITMRGHTIFWAVDTFVQDWVQALSDPDLLDAVSNRLDSVVNHFSDTFVHWDINNEMLHGSFFEDRLGSSIRPWMFDQTRALDPDVELFVNDYNVVSQGETDAYKSHIQDLITAGAEINGIGAQGHFGTTVNPLLTEIRIDSLAELGLPIWISEFDSEVALDSVRADNLEAMYRIAFSKESVEGIMMWGFWAGSHWKGPNAAIVDLDWTLNHAGIRYQSLMAEWTTATSGASNVAGEYDFRGFHGTYDVVLTPPGGLPTLRRFQLDPGAGTNDVTMIVHLTGEKALIHNAAQSETTDLFSFQITGDAGHRYEIKSATNLAPPNWSPVTTRDNPWGTIVYTNGSPSVDAMRHFRAEKLP